MPSAKTLLTMLNAMAGLDITAACDQLARWNVRVLDLKDCIFGKPVENLSETEAADMIRIAESHGQSVHTLSTCLFVSDIEEGEAPFRQRYDAALETVIAAARILRPQVIRLLAASSSKRFEFSNSADYVAQRHPWLIAAYQDAIDRIADAGFQTVIENEVHRCLFAHPQEVLDFFAALDRPESVRLTWDIQNLWQMGTYPTLAVYQKLRPLIGMIHLKGGRGETPGGPLRWRTALEDASWPVTEILRAIIADGVSPVICLNPSHGKHSPEYDCAVTRDLAWLRENFPEVE